MKTQILALLAFLCLGTSALAQNQTITVYNTTCHDMEVISTWDLRKGSCTPSISQAAFIPPGGNAVFTGYLNTLPLIYIEATENNGIGSARSYNPFMGCGVDFPDAYNNGPCAGGMGYQIVFVNTWPNANNNWDVAIVSI
ncbi:MAG: hypothetical protein ACFB10_11205 [Salibacteraceae bacterium]